MFSVPQSSLQRPISVPIDSVLQHVNVSRLSTKPTEVSNPYQPREQNFPALQPLPSRRSYLPSNDRGLMDYCVRRERPAPAVIIQKFDGDPMNYWLFDMCLERLRSMSFTRYFIKTVKLAFSKRSIICQTKLRAEVFAWLGTYCMMSSVMLMKSLVVVKNG